MKKRSLVVVSSIVVLAVLLILVWNYKFSRSNIAFVNYQVTTLGEISKANDNSFIRLRELSTDDIEKISHFDMVFINAMGLRITEAQREVIERAAERGVHILTTAATNPANNINSLDSATIATLNGYLNNGGRQNYRSLLNYVRLNIDKKVISVKEPEEVVKRSTDMIYHADLNDPDGEDLGFNSVAAYEEYLSECGIYDAEKPRVVVTGVMGDATDLVAELERRGDMVYPVRNMDSFVRRHHIDSVSPSALVNMAHGRMGDDIVNYLTKQNIPLFTPLNVNMLVEEWESDNMGMSGGFFSQSVVTPEIDGAIRPYVLFAHYMDDDGLQHLYAIPERLNCFVSTINNYIALQSKPNSEKRVAIYYYKGAGQSALSAGGMEVAPSLYNLLLRMQSEGYDVTGLPASYEELERMIQAHGAIFGSYAEGAISEFMESGEPELISKEEYEEWVKEAIRPEKYREVVDLYGEFPGEYMATEDGLLGVPRIEFGNVVLLPQNAAGAGDNSFKIEHGTELAPPHAYIASYLWSRYGFGADILLHFGTHGSLEFTPQKQVALSSADWPDALVGDMPHLYVYAVNNVGEGVIAKRRAYAGLQSYLTPPFMESDTRSLYRDLTEKIKIYNNTLEAALKESSDSGEFSDESKEKLKSASLAVKEATIATGIHRELELDTLPGVPYSEDDILRIENFAEELAVERVTGALYILGVPYEKERIESSVMAMSADPIAYGLYALDRARGRVDAELYKHRTHFTESYLEPAKRLVSRILANPSLATDETICRFADVTVEELKRARSIDKPQDSGGDMMSMMMMMMMMMGGGGMPEGMPSMGDMQSMAEMAKAAFPDGNMPEGMMNAMRSMGLLDEYSDEEKEFASLLMNLERAIKNVTNYKTSLEESPEMELASLINAMNGGYTAPSPGGDPIVNPNTLPTGRNLYGINAEATPSESAWEKGKMLAESTIEMYRRRHNDSIPRKVSYTLWSGEFIETEGATIAQVLYMLGVEPIRDAFGRVTDLRLIPSEELGRPRIDVVVQTSGQLRDIAASRLFLINRAVEMAAASSDDIYDNQVAEGVVEAEKILTEKGVTPKEAREVSKYRVFGAANGGYGTGIQGMVMSGDRWESEEEIADVYLNNMGAFYGSESSWESFREYAFEAALAGTEVVVQPRQSNTWGALSLDHVFEFMGGLDLTVRNITGKEPDAYMSDYRNRNNAHMQEVKEAIGIESRATIFNPTYIKEKMKGGAGSASSFSELVSNTYGWNVMKPSAIDNEMWDEIYEVFVEDKFDLDLRSYFEDESPASLEEITAVMLETVRKGMWSATDEQVAEIAKLHTELIEKYNPSCSGFVCDNAKLREFIASKSDPATAERYNKSITKIREVTVDGDKGVVMKRESLTDSQEGSRKVLSNTVVAVVVVVAVAIFIFVVRKRRKNLRE